MHRMGDTEMPCLFMGDKFALRLSKEEKLRASSLYQCQMHQIEKFIWAGFSLEKNSRKLGIRTSKGGDSDFPPGDTIQEFGEDLREAICNCRRRGRQLTEHHPSF